MKLFLLTVIFIISIHKFFSRDFCKEYCQSCCDCCKKGNEESEGSEESKEDIIQEKIIPKKKIFEYNWDTSKYKANIDNNLEEEINNLNKTSNAFKYLKIAEAIEIYKDKNNNEILRKNNLRNKIDQYKIIQKEDNNIKKFCDDKYDNTYGGKICNYDFEKVMNLFKKEFYFPKIFFPTEKFFKYFYHPEYLETDFNLNFKPISNFLSDNSENFGYVQLKGYDNLENFYKEENNYLHNYFIQHYEQLNDFYKLRLHQIYKWLEDNKENANLEDPDNIYSLLNNITLQRSGLCVNEAENIISSMYSVIISFLNKNIKTDDIEIFIYNILSDFRQLVANDVVNTMISQPNETNCLVQDNEGDARLVEEEANVIKIYINAFLNTNVGFTQHMSRLSFFDKAVEQANAFLKEFFNFGRLFEITLQYTKQADSNGSLSNFIDKIENIKVSYSDICAINEIPEVKTQIGRKIEVIKNEVSEKSFKERLDLYLNKDNNNSLQIWKNNNSQKPLKELIEICKNRCNEGNYDCYFYLPELTAFYFNNDPDNIINYFTYILFPLYLLKENYIKIKS